MKTMDPITMILVPLAAIAVVGFAMILFGIVVWRRRRTQI